jgi:hypothetical protein
MAGTSSMILEQKRDLALFLAGLKHKKHNWGTFDCNTWWCEWIDRLTGSNVSSEVIGHYHNEKTAMKFARTHNAIEYVLRMGYTQLDVNSFDSIPVTGDVWIQNHRTHYSILMIFQGLAWSISSEHGLISSDPELFSNDKTVETTRFRRI